MRKRSACVCAPRAHSALRGAGRTHPPRNPDENTWPRESLDSVLSLWKNLRKENHRQERKSLDSVWRPGGQGHGAPGEHGSVSVTQPKRDFKRYA